MSHNKNPDPVDPSIAEYLAAYRPRKTDSAWARVESFVKDAVARTEPTTVQQAGQLMYTMWVLAEWSYSVAALPVDGTKILNGYNIQRFAFSAEARRLSPNMLRSHIFRANQVAHKTGWGTRLITGGQRLPVVEPYADQELVTFASAANGQPNSRRALGITTMLGLCRGAGLAANELLEARVGDIIEDDLGMTVSVRRDGRIVPVLAAWEPFVKDAIVGRAANEFAFPYRYPQVPVRRHHPRPNARRLRATWVVDHLNHRVPMNVLLLTAGLAYMDRFIGYIDHMDAVAPEVARALLTRRPADA